MPSTNGCPQTRASTCSRSGRREGRAQAVKMRDPAEAKGLKHRLGQQARANPAIVHARAMVADGYVEEDVLPWARRCAAARAKPASMGTVVSQSMQASVTLWP